MQKSTCPICSDKSNNNKCNCRQMLDLIRLPAIRIFTRSTIREKPVRVNRHRNMMLRCCLPRRKLILPRASWRKWRNKASRWVWPTPINKCFCWRIRLNLFILIFMTNQKFADICEATRFHRRSDGAWSNYGNGQQTLWTSDRGHIAVVSAKFGQHMDRQFYASQCGRTMSPQDSSSHLQGMWIAIGPAVFDRITVSSEFSKFVLDKVGRIATRRTTANG